MKYRALHPVLDEPAAGQYLRSRNRDRDIVRAIAAGGTSREPKRSMGGSGVVLADIGKVVAASAIITAVFAPIAMRVYDRER